MTRNSVCHYEQTAKAGLCPRWHIELGRYSLATGRDGHAAVVRAAIEDVSRRRVHDADERIIRGVLKIIAVGGQATCVQVPWT